VQFDQRADESERFAPGVRVTDPVRLRDELALSQAPRLTLPRAEVPTALLE
jgi:hypothetical protein